jgi:hypothetical protein
LPFCEWRRDFLSLFSVDLRRQTLEIVLPMNKGLGPVRDLWDLLCKIGQNLVFLRGFSGNSFASLINRARARRRARARKLSNGIFYRETFKTVCIDDYPLKTCS